jgi:citrate synthase
MASKKYQLTNLESGRSSELVVHSGSVGPDVLDISTLYKEQGVFTYDPGFMATASASSAITYIDGDAGVLLYRGYPIEQLAKQSSFLEVSYLLQKGELPSRKEFEAFTNSISRHTMLNEWIIRLYRGFHHDAHPMAMVATIVASLAAFYHDSTDINDDRHREIFSHRIIAKLPTIAAAAYKHALGQPLMYPRNDLDYTANMLHMLFAVPCEPYEADSLHAKALDLLFILHADHEQNASTSTVRIAGSTGCNPYTAMSAGVSALWGPAHGGANEAVVDMLEKIGDASHVPEFLAKVKDSKGGVRLMGFGHRVYKNFDPRATIIRDMAHRVLDKLGNADNPLFELALRLEEVALKDDYFISRKLYPNVDFYSGIIYRALGIPRELFTVMFAIARSAGWVAHWEEMIADPEMKIARPRQLYTGPTHRDYVPVSKR